MRSIPACVRAALTCPYRKLCPLAQSRESGDAPAHEGYAQTDLVGGHRALQITSLSEAEMWRCATAQCAAQKSTKRLAFSNFDRLIFAGLYRIAPNVLECPSDCKAGDCYPLASRGFSLFWRWKSRFRGAGQRCRSKIRQLIRE